MGWHTDNAPGHEGYLQAVHRSLNEFGSTVFRDICCPPLELDRNVWHYGPLDRPVYYIQVACSCGWRSALMRAPFGTLWSPCIVLLPRHETDEYEYAGSRVVFETFCAQLWSEHACSWHAAGHRVLDY